MASKQVEGEMFLSICKIVLCPAEILAHQIQFSFDVAFNEMKGCRRQNVAVHYTLAFAQEEIEKIFLIPRFVRRNGPPLLGSENILYWIFHYINGGIQMYLSLKGGEAPTEAFLRFYSSAKSWMSPNKREGMAS